LTMISCTEISSTLALFFPRQMIHEGHLGRPENILYRTKDPSSDIVIADFGMWVVELVLRNGILKAHRAVPSTCIPLKSSSCPLLEASATWRQRCLITRATASPSTSGLSGTHIPFW